MILAAAPGCGSENSRSQQARALLERIADLDLRAPREERASQVERLRTAPVKDPELVRVRDACVSAHAGLLAAEDEQDAIRRRLDTAPDGGVGQAELALMAAVVERAGEKLRAAQAALPACERDTRALLRRYR